MKKNRFLSCTIGLCVMIGMILSASGVQAQKFMNIGDVKYIQLPSEDAAYKTVDVFILKEKDKANQSMEVSFGKLAKKVNNDKIQQGLQGFAKEVLSSKQEKYTTWDLLPEDFTNTAGNGNLKVVMSYLPNDAARPMGTPQKNKEGKFIVKFRVNVKMMLYNEMDEVIMEKDFGAVSGSGYADTWPAAAKGAGDMFKVKVSAEGENDKHPYEEVCIEGALNHVQRVVYGMYGVKEFKVGMKALWSKTDKVTKEYASEMKKILKDKKGNTLSQGEIDQMKQLIAKFDGAGAKMDEKEKWTMDYNLALAYGWIQESAKSREYLQKVRLARQSILDKITNSSGSWGTKDYFTMVAINSLEPFALYYAAGMNANEDYLMQAIPEPSTGGKTQPYFAESGSYTRNVNICKSLDMPIIVPVFPTIHDMDEKKATGTIKKNGQVLANLTYNFEKGKFSELTIKGESGKFSKVKYSRGIPNNAHNDSRAKNQFRDSFAGSKMHNYLKEKKDGMYNIGLGNSKFNTVFAPFAVNDYKGFYGFQAGAIDIKPGANGFAEMIKISAANNWGFESEIFLKENTRAIISSNDYAETYEVVQTDANGYPSQIKVTSMVNNVYDRVHVKIKYKFGETTSAESSRQHGENRNAGPAMEKMYNDAISANNIQVSDGTPMYTYNKEAKNYTMTKTYDVKVEQNGKGNWTKITFGDYEISRTFK